MSNKWVPDSARNFTRTSSPFCFAFLGFPLFSTFTSQKRYIFLLGSSSSQGTSSLTRFWEKPTFLRTWCAGGRPLETPSCKRWRRLAWSHSDCRKKIDGFQLLRPVVPFLASTGTAFHTTLRISLSSWIHPENCLWHRCPFC